jgi:hypothetical protein
MTDIVTSWMWKQDEEIWGLNLNVKKQTLAWMDGIGCACGDSFAEQSLDDFLAQGPRFGNPPDDVVEEVTHSVKSVLENTPK